MRSSSPESSQELRFPPVPVNHSLARLDLNTLIMRSNARRSVGEANTLDDSAYEVLRDRTDDVLPLDDSLYGTSDDEGHTESLASTDGPTPDDVSDFDDEDDDDDEFEHDANEASQQFESAPAHPDDHDPIISCDNSTLTEVPQTGGSDKLRLLKMQEELSAHHNGVEAWAVVKHFDDEQVSGSVLKPYGCAEMRLTVRAALSDRFLPADRSLRIWYVGDIVSWAQQGISSAIGAALVASPGPSRSIMVGGRMEPYGPVLDIDHCTGIKALEESGKAPRVLVTLDDGTQMTFDLDHAPYLAATSRRPDLVIFWYPHTGLAAPALDQYPILRQAFERCSIPCLDIAEHWRFGHYSSTFNPGPKSLRFDVEGRRDQDSVWAYQDTIPIVLATFMDINPVQLNRHLAALSPDLSASTAARDKPDERSWNLRSILPRSMPEASFSLPNAWSTPWKALLAFVFLTSMVISFLLAPAYLPGRFHNAPTVEVESTVPTSISTSSSISASTTAVSAPVVSFTSSATISITPRDLTVVASSQQPSPLRTERKKEEKLGGFQISRTGDHQFLISPSPDFASRKRKPQLQIQVSKDAKAIPIRYVRTIGGMYIVDLEREYPLCSFNVSIATHTKPLMQQSFEITLGHNKSKFGQLIDLVKRDLATMEQGLRDITTTLPKLVRAGVTDAEQGACDWKHKAKKEVDRQVTIGASVLLDMSEATWKNLRRGTAPARTSRAALRARNNAYRIRCGFERAVGLSSKRKEEKKTRSCKKIGW
ncbi:hypothetical protein BU26DRAFT_423262 [Trematosphaeria pertusa]|uniref:Uncharacterized protein n=1 Tax=Trematosphaeria pertusa TaxID=390896 RepID=A0A6A6IKR3_9PLEO|nr:uncharacterized protein BU26DRAFT_423262 [Trematosphaeria pertusa]KAF2251205.1 hypothetical protein BU26DRAFT_423262 [Trematosphaeria pertusa]